MDEYFLQDTLRVRSALKPYEAGRSRGIDEKKSSSPKKPTPSFSKVLEKTGFNAKKTEKLFLTPSHSTDKTKASDTPSFFRSQTQLHAVCVQGPSCEQENQKTQTFILNEQGKDLKQNDLATLKPYKRIAHQSILQEKTKTRESLSSDLEEQIRIPFYHFLHTLKKVSCTVSLLGNADVHLFFTCDSKNCATLKLTCGNEETLHKLTKEKENLLKILRTHALQADVKDIDIIYADLPSIR